MLNVITTYLKPVVRCIKTLCYHLFQGADMVEFDVMLTKDHMPVVYHDFSVCLSYKKVLD